MKTRLNFKACVVPLIFGWIGLGGVTQAQDGPRITGIQRLSNREIQLNLSATSGADYRLDASSDLVNWVSLITLRSLGVDQHTDSGAPYLNARFYRAVPLNGAPPLSGDHLPTANGDLVIHPLFHASLVLSWNGKTIYNDPPTDPTPIPVSVPVRSAVYACCAGMLAIGIWQGPFVNLSFAAVKGLF